MKKENQIILLAKSLPSIVKACNDAGKGLNALAKKMRNQQNLLKREEQKGE